MAEILHGAGHIAALSADWSRLAALQDSPLPGPEWVGAAAAAFHRPEDLRIFVLRDGDRIAAIAPLAATRRFGLPALELIGCARLFEPAGWLYENDAALERLATAVSDAGLPLVLGRMPAAAARGLAALLEKRGRAIARHASPAPWIALDGGWAGYEKRLPARRRQNLHRRQRLARAEGAFDVEVLSPPPAQLPALLERFIAVEASGWKGQRGSAAGANPAMRNFITRLAGSACAAGTLRLAFLSIAGRTAAAALALECYGAFWQIKIGYDERHARCSPGVLLMHECIRHSCEAGLARFEILGANEAWKGLWTENAHPMTTLSWFPRNAAGLALRSADACMRAAGALRRGLRP